MDIKIADIILKGLYKAFPVHAKIWHILGENGVKCELKEIHHILDNLEADDLIVRTEGSYFKITSHGRYVIDEHLSLASFQESIKNEEAAKDEVENVKIEKLKYDAKLSKWQVKTFWPVFIFGMIGGVFGIISFVIQVTADNSPQQNKSAVQPSEVLKADSLELKKVEYLNEIKE